MRLSWAYPPNWRQLSRECKERAGWRCEDCGMAHGAEAVSRRTGVVYRVALAAAHLDHDIWNPAPRLRALCPRCHARYDASRRERARRVELERRRHEWLLHRQVVKSLFDGSAEQLGGSAVVYRCAGTSSLYELVGRVSTFDALRSLALSLAVGAEFEVQLWLSAHVVGLGHYRRVARGVAVVSEDAVAAGLFQAGSCDG